MKITYKSLSVFALLAVAASAHAANTCEEISAFHSKYHDLKLVGPAIAARICEKSFPTPLAKVDAVYAVMQKWLDPDLSTIGESGDLRLEYIQLYVDARSDLFPNFPAKSE